jgi:hypothetical protein
VREAGSWSSHGVCSSRVPARGLLLVVVIRRQVHVVDRHTLTSTTSSPVIRSSAPMTLRRITRARSVMATFTLLRSHARSRRQRLSDLARDVVNGATIPDMLLDPHQPRE